MQAIQTEREALPDMQEHRDRLGTPPLKERIELEMMAAHIEAGRAKAVNPGTPHDLLVVIGRQYYIKAREYYQRLSYSND
jgi:hypothetical protein